MWESKGSRKEGRKKCERRQRKAVGDREEWETRMPAVGVPMFPRQIGFRARRANGGARVGGKGSQEAKGAREREENSSVTLTRQSHVRSGRSYLFEFF